MTDFPDGFAHVSVPNAILMLERPILRALDHPEEGWCRNLRHVEDITGIPREVARAIIHGLIDQGLVEYHRGLWGEDDMPAGAGYCLTPEGRTLVGEEGFDNA